MSVVLLENEAVHYEVLGRGRPVLFLHGWVGSWRYWIPAMQVASGQYRAYGLDFWGFGDTSHQPDRYEIARQLDMLENFLEELGIGKIALVGHGLGAIVGLLLTQKQPERVDRMMAVSLPLESSRLNPRFRLGSPGELADWLAGISPEHESARSETPKTDPLAVQASMEGVGRLEVEGIFRRLTVPRLLVYGSGDQAVYPPSEDDLLNLPSEAHRISFAQSGHFPMLDERNQFNRLLMDFLALGSGESPQVLTLKEEWKRRVR
jgi:pimeloyl-ACP methyl ester carboxylesterase